MGTINITSRYAKALLDTVVEKDIQQQVTGEIELVFKTFSESKELRLVMHNPILRNDKKAEILKEIFS